MLAQPTPSPMENSRPTMQDVARQAGVHQTTVSRALRNDPRLPEATRRRLQALAEEMGYRANPLVSALVVARRSRHPPAYEASLGFIVRRDRDQPPATERQLTARREYAQGAQAAAVRLGFKVEEFVVGSAGLSEERLNTVLTTRNVHGLILAPLAVAHGTFSLDWKRYCVVVIEHTFVGPRFDRIVHDSYAGMRRIMAECRQRGLRRVGLALTTVGHERTERSNGAAYWIEQKEDGFFAEIPPLYLRAWDAAAFSSWMRAHGPEVVVSSNDLLADVQAWCESRRYQVTRDISLVNVNAAAGGTVTGIYQDHGGIGAKAARMVVDKIMHNEWGVPERGQTVMTPGLWVEGTTLARVPTGRAEAGALT